MPHLDSLIASVKWELLADKSGHIIQAAPQEPRQ